MSILCIVQKVCETKLQLNCFLPEASFGHRILSLPESMCVYVCVSVCVSITCCPRNNSGPLQARITKFGPKLQKTLFKVPIVWGAIDLDLQGQIQPKNRNLPPFWACSHHNSLPIQARITKFWPEVQSSLVKIPIVLAGLWPWPSRSYLT